jgi:GT2 family glycosyltransferase
MTKLSHGVSDNERRVGLVFREHAGVRGNAFDQALNAFIAQRPEPPEYVRVKHWWRSCGARRMLRILSTPGLPTVPTISVITPNKNGAKFLSQTIESVIFADQGSTEHIIVDGCSSDASQQIIAKYRSRIAKVIVEKDDGVYDALNKGFSASSGEIMCWINSSDILMPDSLSIVGEIFDQFPEIEWLTSRSGGMLDERGRLISVERNYGFTRSAFMRGEHLAGYSKGPSGSFIQQESTFWRRSLWDRVGGRLDTNYKLAADFDLWVRFFGSSDPVLVPTPLGAFRRHNGQLSQDTQSYLKEASTVLRSRGGRPRTRITQAISVGLRASLPRSIRPLAHALNLFPPARICEYDAEHGWKLGCI